ncbi:Uncharacterised protein [Mycobacteroides abscessus subsp. abscessus]|nr:Uncharacterised protein [Mycobacteroides abscessus subsp. abscessus]
MVAQHRRALLRVKDVPVVGADERVHADVGAGLVVGEQRRQVSLVELGGAVEADDRPHGFEDSPEQGPADRGVRGLDEFDRRRVVPEHHVGVGAQGGDVIDAADDETLLPQRGERLVELGGELGAVSVAEFGGSGEDRVRDVAGLLVGAFDLLLGGLGVVAHCFSFVSSGLSVVISRSATVWARPMQAGMPTPE